MHIIGREIDRLIKEYNVTHIICEGSYKSVNVRTSQQLARLSGIAMYLAIDNGIEIEACNPSSARKYTLGKGGAKKEEVYIWVKDNYWDMGEFSDKETKTIKKTSDLYDAGLLCIFFLKKYKLDKKYGTNK